MKTASLVIASVASAAFGFAAPARAFTLNSSSDPSMQGWANHTVVFNVNAAGCPAGIDDIIDGAMAAWNGVASSDLVVRRGVASTTTFATANAGTATDYPVILCDTSFGTDSGIGGNGIAGVARVSNPATGGHITRAFLMINVDSSTTGNIASANATTVAIVLAHEIGHALGLGHSQDANALMYYNASAKTQLTLAQDDVDGITYLYPRDETSGGLMGCGAGLAKAIAQGPGSGRKPPTPPPAGPAALALALPLAAWFLLRRRRRFELRRGRSFELRQRRSLA